jgi:iron complex outermembrane receptor protein
VLYGDNAAGGVINIITKEGEKFSAGLDTAVGSFGTFKANGYVSGDVKDKLPFYLSAGTMTSSGYRDNSYTRAQDLGAKVGYYPTSSLKLGLDAGYHKQHTGLPGTLSEADIAGGIPRTGTKTPDDFTNVQDYYLQLLPELSIGGDNLVRMDLSYRKRTFLSYATFSAGNFTGDAGIETITASPQVLFKTQVAKAVNSLTAGLDFLKAKEGIENTSLFYGSLSTGNYDLEKKNYGAYLHDELALTPNLRLSAGYRKDRAEFSFSPSVLSGISLDADAYTAGINYAFSGKSYVYGSYSRSFRYPVFDELYSFFTNTINPSISPQTSNDYEVGMRYYFTDQVYCHVNVFKMDTDDEIFYNPATFNNENMAGATERLGVEASFFAKVLETLSLRGSYTHMNATMNGGAYDGKHVPNVPEHRAALEATYQPSMPLTLVLNGEYVGERPYISDFAHDFSNQGSYVVLNARVEYKYKQAKVFLNVNNLADKKYSEFGAIGDFPLTQKFFPSPGRNFMLGVSAAL